jgi:surface protein
MWKTCLGGCGSHEVQGEVVETTQSGGEIVTLIFSDGPISIGYDAHADSAADFQGMVFEAAFYDCEQSSSSGPPPSTIAYAFEPDCAAVANATSQAQALKVIDTEYAFDRAGSYVYVRADATTADTLSGWQDLFLWGGTVQCDGLFFGLDNGQLFVGQQCNSAIYAVDLAEFAPAASTRYVFEVYFRDATNELRIWVDEIEVTPSGGTTFDLTWTDGYASLGYGAHNNYIEPWGGTVHDLSFYECVAPTSAGPPPAAGPFTSSANLKSAVDNCIAATVNPDLTLYPSCVATDVPPGSGRFCCSLCGADCLDGGATDMPDWNVSQVTSFYGLFDGKGDFDEDLSSWDVSSVTNMERTFLGASAFNSPIGDWNVASVTTMDSMFQDASAFDANITGWSSPQSSQNMFLGAAAFLARFANCGVGTPDATVCLRDTYPQSSAAYDGPAAAWDSRFCDFSALAPADGGLGECDAQVPKGTMCAPTCADSSALAMKGVCGKVTIPPACVCECAEKRAMFGFNV